MKKKLLFVFSNVFATLVFMLLAFGTTKAQIINENFEEADWRTLNGTSGQVILPAKTTTSTASYLTASTSFTTALNTNDNAGTWWYSKATSQSNNKLDKVHSLAYSVKLSSSGYVVTPVTKSAIVSVTFWAQLATPMTVGILTDTKAGQPSYSSSYPIPGNFSNFSTSFPANNVMTSYSINFTGITAPVRIGFFNFGGSSSYIDDIVVMPPVGTPPTVTTDNVVPAITNADVTGTVTKGTLPLLASGIIWSTSPLTGNAADTALSTKTWKTPSSITTFTDKIGPLSASTIYYTNAYVIALDGTVYFGTPKQFTTNPLSKPSVDIKINNVYSYKVDATGFKIDSGGVYVSEKGFVYNTVGNPQIGAAGSTQVKFPTSGVADFTDLIKNLKANTTYCFKAYAKNSIGIGYSKDTCIKTGAVAPYLTAVPGAIDFGENFYGSDPITVSYILTGANLTPGSGAITVTCPAPFKISLQPGTGFSNSLSINYFSGKLTSTPIFVQLPTSAYGTWGYSSILSITHSGGGVAAVDADAVKISGSITQAPDDISNRGSDFLLGFGYQEKMSRKAGDADECKLSLYVTTGDQPATVHVDLNSGGYSQIATIPANSYKEFTGFPMGDATDPTNPNNLPDTRLFSTGISKKSIHVYTDNNVPVSVFSHSYTKGNTAAGAMIFPTNTWNSSYTVQAFGGTSNNSNPNSFFFVIANEDNTEITFKPTQPILDATAASLPLPIASFEQKTVSCAGKEVEFTDKSDPVTTGTTLTQWVWDYGDGTKETKTNNTNLKHTYAVGGAYTVKLVVKNSKGCVSDTFRLAVNVYPNPVANFDLPGNICLPNAVGTFKNTTTITDGTGNQISYVWNFGDGTPDQSVAAPSPTNINHTYTAVGPFTIKLTATSNQGCVGETSKTLSTIFDQPKASFDAPTEVCLNDDASFSSTSTAASSTISRWFWDLGTGSFTEGKKDTTESWSVSGDKTIQLYAISAVGCYSDTALKTVTVNPLPIASLELKSSSCAGKDVEFTDKSDAVTTSATLTQWFLDYGDGSNEILNNNLSIKHTYAVGGSYTVKLVVKNSKGCVSDTFRLPIFVYPNPVPGFKVSDICLPLVNAQFTDTSKITSGSIVKWTWDFGDGSTAGTDQNPLHVYAIGNQYNVTLTVESDHGCSTTGTPVAIYAYNAPTAGDSVVLANNLCSNLPVKLVNTSAVNGYGSVTKLEVYWDYANNPSLKTTDNAPVVGTTYEYKYPEFGTPLTKTYQLVVRAYTNTGCFDDSVQTITLHASPKVVFNAIPGVCQEADTVLLTQAYDQYALAPNIGYYSGTGVLDGTNRFVPALAGPGTHVIRYDDTTAIGCVSSATQSIVVYPTPIIKMAPTKAILEGDSYTLNPTVTGIIQSYLWSPTTYMLSSNTIINPVVKPEKDITYTLTVTTTNGCEADSSIFIKVLKNFEVPNTFTPNNDGINDHWKIKELPDYPIHRVQIFNRYGQIVYETKAYPARGWDGNYNGKSLPIGTYYYIIELNGVVNPKVGYVTILK